MSKRLAALWVAGLLFSGDVYGEDSIEEILDHQEEDRFEKVPQVAEQNHFTGICQGDGQDCIPRICQGTGKREESCPG